MIEGLKQLIELQELDDALAAAEGELGRLPVTRARFAEQRAAAEVRVAEAQQALQAAEGLQRGAETRLQDQEALLAKLESQQHQVKSNDAYTVLLREMEEAKEAISEAETQILETMETIEAAGVAHERTEAEVAAFLGSLVDEETALDAREQKLEARAAELRGHREGLREQLPPELLGQYETIAKRCTPAVAHVVRQICQGCRLNIPPQLHIELRDTTRLHVCPNCRRILVPEVGGN